MNYQSLTSNLFTGTQKASPLQRTKSCYGIHISARRQNPNIVLRLGMLFLLLLFFGGCASINILNMVPDATKYSVQHPSNIALTVERGQKSGVGWYSGSIKPSDFEKAILKSLEKAKLFKGVVNGEAADYLINVKLIYAGSHPGFNMNAWVNAQWSIIDQSSKEIVWSKLVEGKGHATVGDAFVGAKRQFMALERGAKANIDEALREIGKLEL